MNNTEPTPEELIEALRGGKPETCSFCGRPTRPEELHPEEAGDWACITCINKWRANGEQY